MPRDYNSVSTIDKTRLIQAHEDGRDYLELATELGVKRNTAYRIVWRYLRREKEHDRKRGGSRRQKVDQEMVAVLVEFIEDQPSSTLKELKSRLEERMPQKPIVSLSTIARMLDGQLITVKLLRDIPCQRNRADIKLARQNYANWFLQEGMHARCIFIDECGFNAWTRRSNGRSRQGHRAYRLVLT